MKTITFEVMNDDGTISFETTKVMELPKFNTVEQLSSFISTAFKSESETLPSPPEVIVLI